MKIARREMVLVAIVAGAATLAACTLLVTDSEVQCASAADCRARGPAFANAVCVASVCQVGDAGTAGDGGPWDCLDHAPLPSPVGGVDVEIVLYNALSPVSFGGSVPGGNDLTLLAYTPQPGVDVTACQMLDTSCSGPVAGPTTSDDAGTAHLLVEGAFNGFFTLTRLDSVSSLLFPGRLVQGEPSVVTFPTSLTSNFSYSNLQAATGIPANQDTDGGPGLVAVTQYDCNELRASGVTFAVDPAAARIVYVGSTGFPDMKATATATNGAGLLVNVPAMAVEVTSNLGSRVLDTVDVLVRSGGITLVKLRPRAR